jgi:hypothetical protein
VVEESAAGIEVECSALGPVDAPEISTPGEIVLTGFINQRILKDPSRCWR